MVFASEKCNKLPLKNEMRQKTKNKIAIYETILHAYIHTHKRNVYIKKRPCIIIGVVGWNVKQWQEH